MIYSCSLPKKRLKKHQILEKWDHLENQPSCKAYSFCKNVNLGQKLQFQKTCQNLFYKWFTVVLCKTPLQRNTKYSRNEMILKIRHHLKPYALWVKNLNSKKYAEIYSTSDLQLFCAKNRLKKHQMFKKWDHFENGRSWKAYIESKIKIPKSMSKSILQVVYSCSVQKTTWKNTKYSRNETILKIGHHAKPIAFKKSSLWVKNYNSKKHVKIYSTSDLQLFCAKHRLKKDLIFKKWDHFENRPSWKTYSLCKIVTLGQKCKLQKHNKIYSYKWITVVLCQKNAWKNT